MSDINPAEHLRLATRIVSKHIASVPRHAHLRDDLTAAAYLGLCEAAKRFDPRVAKWSTYACIYAHGYMLQEVAHIAGATRAPRYRTSTRLVDPRTYSLDVPVRGFDDTTWLDLLEATDEDPEAATARAEDADRVRGLLEHLDPRSRHVIERRFGLGDDRDLTLCEVGEEIGVCRERVRQLEAKALAKLRRAA